MKIQSRRRTTEVGKKYALERKHRFDGKDLRLIMRSVRRKVHFSRPATPWMNDAHALMVW